MVYHKILNLVPSVTQKDLAVYHTCNLKVMLKIGWLAVEGKKPGGESGGGRALSLKMVGWLKVVLNFTNSGI